MHAFTHRYVCYNAYISSYKTFHVLVFESIITLTIVRSVHLEPLIHCDDNSTLNDLCLLRRLKLYPVSKKWMKITKFTRPSDSYGVLFLNSKQS